MSTSNIKRIFSMATPQEIRDGVVWYAEAQKQCREIARDLDLPLRVIVGVAAALSPNNKWERNVLNARALAEAFLNGDAVESVKVSTYRAMRAKAWSILEAGIDATSLDIAKLLNGQKIVAFYRCIMGENTCCVDGHALNIWRDERQPLSSDKTNITKKMYQQIAADYAKAGEALGFKAYEVQAITWVAWRRIHGIK